MLSDLFPEGGRSLIHRWAWFLTNGRGPHQGRGLIKGLWLVCGRGVRCGGVVSCMGVVSHPGRGLTWGVFKERAWPRRVGRGLLYGRGFATEAWSRLWAGPHGRDVVSPAGGTSIKGAWSVVWAWSHLWAGPHLRGPPLGRSWDRRGAVRAESGLGGARRPVAVPGAHGDQVSPRNAEREF